MGRIRSGGRRCFVILGDHGNRTVAGNEDLVGSLVLYCDLSLLFSF